jgi:hypothetical protein
MSRLPTAFVLVAALASGLATAWPAAAAEGTATPASDPGSAFLIVFVLGFLGAATAFLIRRRS